MKQTRSPLVFIFITILIDIIGMAIIIPVIPKLIEQFIGAGVSEASKYGAWLLFTYAIMQFICSPILGVLSDRFGRRPILLISLLGMGINYVLLIFAPNLTWLFIGRALSGIAGASITTASAFIADISEPEKRAQNFGLIGVAFGLGFIIGPFIGGMVADYSARAPFMVSAVLAFINFIYGLFALPESLKLENRSAFSWKKANPINAIVNLKKHPVISQLAISLTLIYLASHAVQSTWSYYTMYKFSWNEKAVGWSLGFFGILMMIVQGVIIRITNKYWQHARSLIVGMLFYILTLPFFAFVTEGWMMYIIMIPYCLGGIADPSLQGIMSNNTPANEQGALQGALTGLMSLTSIFGPLLMLNLFHRFSGENAIYEFPGIQFVLASLLMLLALIFALPFINKIKLKK